jgi:flagellar hook-length control protein FliK
MASLSSVKGGEKEMDASLLTNLLPITNVQAGNGALSPNSGGGEEGAFQLLLENMLFEVVTGQVFKEGGGLLAGMDLGLFTGEGQEGKEQQGQDLLALLEMLQGPLLEHFREAQPQLGLAHGAPVPQGQENQASMLPVLPEMEGKSLTAGMEQANSRVPAGQVDNPIQITMAEVQFQEQNLGSSKSELNNLAVKAAIMENQIKFEGQPTVRSAPQIGSGAEAVQIPADLSAGHEHSNMNLLGDQNHKNMEIAQQANSAQQSLPEMKAGRETDLMNLPGEQHHRTTKAAQQTNSALEPLADPNAGRETNFMNLMVDQNQKNMELAQQVNSAEQAPRAGAGIGYSELADQIIQSGKLKLLGDKQEMEIQLKPEYLGKLAIRLSLENGVMTARFLIENHQVARMVDSNLPQLKQTLEDQGVRFDQVQVEVGDPGSSFQERHREWHRQSDNHFTPLTIGDRETGEETVDYQELGSQGGIDYRA